jgi:hypothetical protein
MITVPGLRDDDHDDVHHLIDHHINHEHKDSKEQR